METTQALSLLDYNRSIFKVVEKSLILEKGKKQRQVGFNAADKAF